MYVIFRNSAKTQSSCFDILLQITETHAMTQMSWDCGGVELNQQIRWRNCLHLTSFKINDCACIDANLRTCWIFICFLLMACSRTIQYKDVCILYIHSFSCDVWRKNWVFWNNHVLYFHVSRIVCQYLLWK